MNIFYDFDFINDSFDDVYLSDYRISSQDIKTSINIIEQVRIWAKNSIFKSCFHRVDIILSDCPGYNVDYVDYVVSSDSLFINMNILGLIWDFYKEPILKKAIFKKEWDKINLSSFVSFFVLHELGHIIQCFFISPNERKITDKYQSCVLKYQSLHINLDKNFHKKKYEKLNNDLLFYKKEKKYRQIPNEKFSDSFATNYLNLFNTER